MKLGIMPLQATQPSNLLRTYHHLYKYCCRANFCCGAPLKPLKLLSVIVVYEQTFAICGIFIGAICLLNTDMTMGITNDILEFCLETDYRYACKYYALKIKLCKTVSNFVVTAGVFNVIGISTTENCTQDLRPNFCQTVLF
jgi:hypothetical protein